MTSFSLCSLALAFLDLAFEIEGFCVVRGPDLLWGGDIQRFHPPAGTFDGVIGGPPCQAHSRLRHLVEAKGLSVAPDLIPEFCRCVNEAQPSWYLMENVPAAPVPCVPGYKWQDQIIEDSWVGGLTSRRRRFTFGSRDGRPLVVPTLALHTVDPEPAVCGDSRSIPVGKGGSGKPKTTRRKRRSLDEMKRLQGLPDDYDLPGFSQSEKYKALGNGVPLPMGRAIARAILDLMET